MRKRLGYVSKAPFEAAVAVASLLTSITYVIDPRPLQASAAGHAARELLPFWIVLYGIAGLFVLVGLFNRSLRTELAGLIAFASALAINTFAIANFAGVMGVASVTIFAALTLACFARGHFLWRSYQDAKRND